MDLVHSFFVVCKYYNKYVQYIDKLFDMCYNDLQILAVVYGEIMNVLLPGF